jgi:hypothetical protein
MPVQQLRPADAATLLQQGHDEVARVVAVLTAEAALRTGLGGGDWSAKDLLGHLTSWEEHALAALDAWAKGKTAPIHRALRTDGLDTVNLAAVRAKADKPYERIRADFDAVNRELRERIETIPDAVWEAPPTPRSRRSLGERLGSILVGRSGPFGHADSHLPDLRALVAAEG